MAHLDAEDIARFVEGNIDKDERERFLKHFSQCRSCLKAYTQTFKIVEEERRRKPILKFSVLGKISNMDYGVVFSALFQKKVVVPALVMLIVVLLILPHIRKQTFDDDRLTAKIQYIEEGIEEMERTESYAFSQSKDKVKSAIRAGFFTEDLRLLLQSDQKEELITRIIEMFSSELRVFFENDAPSPLPDPALIKKQDFETIVGNIGRRLEKDSLSELYRLGRFLEITILSTFENKRPGKKEIEKYLMIARNNNLPLGVIRDLERLKDTSDILTSKEICQNIKEVF
jgi:hypothetical protein